MPGGDDLIQQLRLGAMLLSPTDPLRAEVNDEKWGDYGRAVYNAMMSDRFVQAVLAAVCAYDAQSPETPQTQISRRLRVFLTTGTIA